MISRKLRARLETFISEHGECEGEENNPCIFEAVSNWVDELAARGYPRKELLLLGLAYQVYLGREAAFRSSESFVPPKAMPRALKLVP